MAIWSFLVVFFLVISVAAFLALTAACVRPNLFPKLTHRRALGYLALTALVGYLLMAVSLTLQDPLLWRYDRLGPTATIHRIPGYFPPPTTRLAHRSRRQDA
ncbi:MAG: hypothetical protein ACYCS1_10725 [Gammaproteobacteria bacterium]